MIASTREKKNSSRIVPSLVSTAGEQDFPAEHKNDIDSRFLCV